MVTKGKWEVAKVAGDHYGRFKGAHAVRGGNSEEVVAICSGQELISNTSVRVSSLQALDNAHLIVTAVNQCIAINPDNPQAVAENIERMREAIKGILLVAHPINNNCLYEFEKTYLGTFAVAGNRLEELVEVLASIERKANG